MPNCLPRNSAPCNDFFSHLPACSAELARGSWRASASINPIVNSATAMAFAPGVFITTMPRRVAASASMLSTPTPARPITRNFGRSFQQRVIDLHGRTNNQRICIRQFRRQSVLDLVVGHHLPTALPLQNSQGGGRNFFCQDDLQLLS